MKFILLAWILSATATAILAPHFIVHAQEKTTGRNEVEVAMDKTAADAQAKPEATKEKGLTPTPAQQTQLELKQKDAIIATQKLQLLQQQEQQAEMGRQQALAALNAQADAVKKENKWDDKTVFNANDITFSAPLKSAEKAAK